MDKYNAFTFVKWIYLFGFIMVLPLAGANFNRELDFGSNGYLLENRICGGFRLS
jgi:hypothetical protein